MSSITVQSSVNYYFSPSLLGLLCLVLLLYAHSCKTKTKEDKDFSLSATRETYYVCSVFVTEHQYCRCCFFTSEIISLLSQERLLIDCIAIMSWCLNCVCVAENVEEKNVKNFAVLILL